MIRNKDIFNCLDAFAPCNIKMDFDNVGLLCGKRDTECKRILIALDITDVVISEAIEIGAGLIVSHHPMFFGLKSVTDETPDGRKIIALLENNISAICMHTNLDAAEGGVNDALAEAVGLDNIRLLKTDGYGEDGKAFGIGRLGELRQPTDFSVFLHDVKAALNAGGLRFCKGNPQVHKVAVVGGSGGDYLETAKQSGCDTLLTADVKYHVFINAKEMGMNIIDGGHFPTENVVLDRIRTAITEKYPTIEITISKAHKDTVEFI